MSARLLQLLILLIVLALGAYGLFISELSAGRDKIVDELECLDRTLPRLWRHTRGCRTVEGVSADGQLWLDDCNRLNWPYYEIECDGRRFWGWGSWNNGPNDRKELWIRGNRFFLSCEYREGTEYGVCEYDFSMPR